MATVFDRMRWLNEPRWGWEGDHLWVETQPGTDCWQRTHYGFSHDNAHALVCPVPATFRMCGRFRFEPNAQYDQCGLIVRADADCWFKCSVEFEAGSQSRLGSVVTNGGYSDWATQDISSETKEMSYEVLVKDRDIMASYSLDGADYRQMRIARLASEGPFVAGIYGCSPVGKGFRFEVSEFKIE
jgi:hypothetical protein